MRKIIPSFTLIFACCAGFLHAQDKTAMKFAETITVEDAKKHLGVLASDEYEGRETGKEGQKKAAKYIAESFKRSGALSATDETYFQNVPLVRGTPEDPSLEIADKKYELYKDFYLFPYGRNLSLEAKNILFLGYGISDEKYDDYKNADVKGRVLLILGGEPVDDDSISFITGKKEYSSWTTNFRKKSELAREKGAAAILTVNVNFEKNVETMKHYFESSTLRVDAAPVEKKEDEKKEGGKKEEKKRLPQAGISIKTANELFAREKLSNEEIRKKIRTTRQPVSFEIQSNIELEIKTREEKIISENVLGVVRGSEHPEEVIFVTAHYDHLGVREGKVYNGADDDGSGTVAVMEMAEAFAKAKAAGFGPKRTLVFMTVTGEEKGLLGSSYYTTHPIFPIEKTVCDLNIDMIGRTDDHYKDTTNYVYIIGSDKISTDLHKINDDANATYTKLKLDYKFNDPKDPNRFYYRSDHYNFAEKGVPIIFYFNGTHDDYHEETDEISKINFDILVKRAQLVFYTAWEVANRKDRIVSDVPQEKSK